jgi:hypothetical protein
VFIWDMSYIIYSGNLNWLLNERKIMKYTLLALLTALSVSAQEGPKGPPPGNRPPRPKLTEEQKAQRAALVAKYDVNKDGKLDKEERTKVSDDDRKLMRSFGPPPGGKPGKPPIDGPRGSK